MASTSPTLTIRPANSLRDFMIIRKIRNSCREFMTRDESYISFWRQFIFYFQYYTSDRMRIIYIGENEKHSPIAYAMVAYDDEFRPWISGGLIPKQRGKGYGEQLFRFLSTSWHISIWLEVLESNAKAKALYDKLGFQEVERRSIQRKRKEGTSFQETIITMVKE